MARQKRSTLGLVAACLSVSLESRSHAFVLSPTTVRSNGKASRVVSQRSGFSFSVSKRDNDDGIENGNDYFFYPDDPGARYPNPSQPLDYFDPAEKSKRTPTPPFLRRDDPSKENIQPYEPSSSSSKSDPPGRYYDYDYDNYDTDQDYYHDEEVEVDDYYYDDDDGSDEPYYEEEDTAGNFWSNPPGRYDPVRQPKRRVPRPDEPARVRRKPPSPRKRSHGDDQNRRRSTFRSGTPAAPPVFNDLYNQLFWYGFDPDESTSPADKTMFGGTKGKFNGLAYLSDTQEDGVPRPALPPRGRNDNYYDDDEDYDVEDEDFNDTLDRIERGAGTNYYDVRSRRKQELYYNDEDDKGSSVRSNERPIIEDPEVLASRAPSSSRPDSRPKRKRRPRRSPWEDEDNNAIRRQSDKYYDEYEEDYKYEDTTRQRRTSSSQKNGWVSPTVSNWFTDEDNGDPEWKKRRMESSGKSSGKRNASWRSPFEAVGNFLGFDNGELDYQAEMYNRQMGIGPRKGSKETWSSQRHPDRRRQGYAYRYDVDMSVYGSVVDADVVEDDANGIGEKVKEDGKVQKNRSSNTDSAPDPAEDQGSTKKERSWQERAIAMERIPPAGVPAWGPSGDLGMDARMKATIDAMQDIQDAKYRLNQKLKREEEALDDITILKVDLSVQQRRLANNKQEARKMREEIRRIELEIEDAARSLRKARNQVQFAKEKLVELEDRHWAILGLYNPTQAEENVANALRELEENEPAARLSKRENTNRNESENGR